jgi:hypothetical protein
VFIGFLAGYCNTFGAENVFAGRCAGFYNTTGNDNAFFGTFAGRKNTTGIDNLFAGHCAGCAVTTGSNNIFLGRGTGAGACGLATITTESDRIIIGNQNHTCAQIQVAWTAVSDIRDKCIFGSVPHGRGFLQNITPIKFGFKDRETGCLLDDKKRYGFSAQEVLEAEGNEAVIVSDDNPDKFFMTQDYLVPVLVNAIKELSAELDVVKARLVQLENNS